MSNCKFKKPDNERFCLVLNGECQFITCRYGEKCPIYNAFKNWVPPGPQPPPGPIEYGDITMEDGSTIAFADIIDIVASS